MAEITQTISNTPKNALPYQDSYGYTKKFVAPTLLPLGTVVTLASDGAVEPQDADTEVALGVVVVPNEEAGGYVTVQCSFKALIYGTASGALTAGGSVRGGGVVSGVPVFAATATDLVAGVAGIALEDIADTEKGYIGIY